jgi:hypothetical protein
MKRLFLHILAVGFLLTSFNLNAQHLYFSLHGGYNMGLSKSTHHYLNPTGAFFQEELETYDYGTGIDLGMSAGYMFSENLGINLGLSYRKSQQFEFKLEDITHHSDMFLVNPGLVLSTGNADFKPYALVGFVLGFGKITSTVDQSMVYSQEELYGGFGLGFNTALGIEYSLNEKIKLFSECNLLSLSWAPEKAQLVQYKLNGMDYLDDLSRSEKEVDFMNEYLQTYELDGQENEPQKTIKYNYSFSTVGLKIGVKIVL